MKNLKRLGTMLLSLVLALSMAVPAIAAEGTGYTDVDAGASYAEAVIYCREHELMNGVGNGRFDPEGNLTRAALATVLYRMEGEPSVTGEDSFTDTDSGVWYSNAILWASQRELMGGYGGGIFGTDDPVTRQDMANHQRGQIVLNTQKSARVCCAFSRPVPIQWVFFFWKLLHQGSVYQIAQVMLGGAVNPLLLFFRKSDILAVRKVRNSCF